MSPCSHWRHAGHIHNHTEQNNIYTYPPPPPCVTLSKATVWDTTLSQKHTPCVTFRRVVVSLRGPGQSPVLPFACCVGSLRSVGRCGRCSCWCRFRVRGAASLVCWGCAGGGGCRLLVSGAQYLAYWGCAGCCGGRFAVHTPPSSGSVPPLHKHAESQENDGQTASRA